MSAHKLRLVIAATTKNDTVGRALSDLNMAMMRSATRSQQSEIMLVQDCWGGGLEFLGICPIHVVL